MLHCCFIDHTWRNIKHEASSTLDIVMFLLQTVLNMESGALCVNMGKGQGVFVERAALAATETAMDETKLGGFFST